MQDNNIYIHYGHKTFEKELFNPIKNRQFVKPSGGLWASNINAKYGWKKWIIDNDFMMSHYFAKKNNFKFKLKDNAKVLVINDSEQLLQLPKEGLGFEIPSITTLDFEELQKEYDAIEVLISKDRQLYWDLYGWDCDSILIMNKECIEIIE